MRIIFTLTLYLITAIAANSQNLYIKTFGKSKDHPVVFLHGGPGYNCANFEATTAQLLADQGLFVIVYDRRGEGRSTDKKATFTFKETFDDLNVIYKKYNLTKATLIGHSYGGVVATLFAESNPTKVQSVILVGAPVSLQATFKNILARSKNIYSAKSDSTNLKYVSMLEHMDTTSMEYSSYCFLHAMQNHFYSPANPTPEATKIYATFKTDTILTYHASKMTYEAPQGFWKNEKYTTLDLTKNLQALQTQHIKIYGLYGKDDGLYSIQQVEDLQKLVGSDHVKYFDNCSHNVFVDQQSLFIEAVKTWTR